jgi:hypothetical protein
MNEENMVMRQYLKENAVILGEISNLKEKFRKPSYITIEGSPTQEVIYSRTQSLINVYD